MTLGIAAAGRFFTDCKRFLRCSSSDCTFKYTDNLVSLPRSGGLEFSYCHCLLYIAEKVDCLAFADGYGHLLPRRGLAAEKTALGPARFVLAAHDRCVDLHNLYAIEILDGRLDLCLVGLGTYAERVAIKLLCQLGRLLGQDWFQLDIHCVVPPALKVVKNSDTALGENDGVVIHDHIRIQVGRIHQGCVRHITGRQIYVIIAT